MGIFYLVATPIGNLEDISLRALRILKAVRLIAAEDTRSTGRLLKHFGIATPLISYYEHNKLMRLEQILEALHKGDVALVSEAGTPLLSDPGYELVQAAIERGYTVTAVPGPSALTAALSLSGLPSDRFLFLGFLPRKATARRQALSEVATLPATLVFYEAPHRLRATLADAVEVLGSRRHVALCRELTKLYEEVWRGSLAEALAAFSSREPRGEFTVVVEGAPPAERWPEAKVVAALRERLARGESRSQAARQVAAASGWSRSEVYNLSTPKSPRRPSEKP